MKNQFGNPAVGLVVQNGQSISIDTNGCALIKSSDSFLYLSIGLPPQYIRIFPQKDTYEVRTNSQLLSIAYVKPIDPILILDSALHFYKNWANNKNYAQKGHFREVFLSNDSLLKMQDVFFESELMSLKNDKRPYFFSTNSINFIKSYQTENENFKALVKQKMGANLYKKAYLSHMSWSSYIKQANILNRIFDIVLNPNQSYSREYQYLGISEANGQECFVISTIHFYNKNPFVNLILYVSTEDYSIIRCAIQSFQAIPNKVFLDWRARVGLWLMGINLELKNIYGIVNFQRPNKGYWLKELFLNIPMRFEKKGEKFDCSSTVKYVLGSPFYEKVTIINPKSNQVTDGYENFTYIHSPNLNFDSNELKWKSIKFKK